MDGKSSEESEVQNINDGNVNSTLVSGGSSDKQGEVGTDNTENKQNVGIDNKDNKSTSGEGTGEGVNQDGKSNEGKSGEGATPNNPVSVTPTTNSSSSTTQQQQSEPGNEQQKRRHAFHFQRRWSRSKTEEANKA